MTGDHLSHGPARIFIDGEELVGGMDSMRWADDGGARLISEHHVEITAEAEEPEVDGWTAAKMALSFGPAADEERSFIFNIVAPRVRWWQRFVCAIWFGHKPVRVDWLAGGLSRDLLTCRCGKVTEPAENVERLRRRR